ncbi:GNAT family N-acetyltransferase [Nocardia higoensis]|uniref:GNAT family N-acetyltransferase n=1 Tax=Nocardia higoensis TaxID=228599 RepID=UPI000685C5F6|nr:GNAT family N-acetyltransferase [Nocardia higoensis]
MSEVSVQAVTAAEAAKRLDAISALYQQVFSVPPNVAESPAEHHASMVRMLADPSFGCALAECGEELVGFAYGYGLTSGRWWEGLRDPVPEGFTTEWAGRTFAVIDIGVSVRWRRQRVGARLMETLLGGRREQRASLGVIPALSDSARFYSATGWILVGTQDSPPDAGWTSPVFDVYVRELATGTGSR